MLVGFFDLFVLFALLFVAAQVLQRWPSAPPVTRWWVWIVGIAYGICMLAGAAGLNSAMSTPPVIGQEPLEAPPMAKLGDQALIAAHVVVAAGAVWLLALAALTFTRPAPAEPEGTAD